MSLSLAIPQQINEFWSNKPKVTTPAGPVKNTGVPGLSLAPQHRKPLLSAALAPSAVGVEANPTSSISLSSGVDFGALQAFVNKQKGRIGRMDRASLHSKDNSFGATAKQYTEGKRKDRGLAAHFNNGGFNISGGTYKNTYDGRTKGKGQHANVGYDNDRFGLAGSFNKHAEPYYKDVNKALQGRYSPDFGGNVTLDIKQNNKNRPSAELGYSTSF